MFPLLQFLEGRPQRANIDYFHGPRTPVHRSAVCLLADMAYYLIYSIRPDLVTWKFADHATEDPAKHFRSCSTSSRPE